jgi:hypothetical protein
MRGLTVSVPKTFAARDAGECSVERKLAEVVTISAVGNTSLAVTAKNTMFEDLIVNKYYPHHQQSCLHLPYGTVEHLIELYLVQKEQIWFGNKYGPAERGLTSSQSPFCNPTPNPSCNPNPNFFQAILTLTLSLQSKFLPNPKCCRFLDIRATKSSYVTLSLQSQFCHRQIDVYLFTYRYDTHSVWSCVTSSKVWPSKSSHTDDRELD